MTRRIVSYVIAAAVAALLVATISSERLVSFSSIPAVALFALLLGMLDSAVAPLLGRVQALSGCWPFAVATLLLNAGLFWLAGRALPGIEASLVGALVGAIVSAGAAAAVFTLLDERIVHG